MAVQRLFFSRPGPGKIHGIFCIAHLKSGSAHLRNGCVPSGLRRTGDEWSSKKEKIYISQDIVKVERGINKAEYSWKEFRTFTYFNIKKERDKSIRLSFRSKGKDIFIIAKPVYFSYNT